MWRLIPLAFCLVLVPSIAAGQPKKEIPTLTPLEIYQRQRADVQAVVKIDEDATLTEVQKEAKKSAYRKTNPDPQESFPATHRMKDTLTIDDVKLVDQFQPGKWEIDAHVEDGKTTVKIRVITKDAKLVKTLSKGQSVEVLAKIVSLKQGAPQEYELIKLTPK